MYLFTIVATPKPDNPELFEVGGAYVNAWVSSPEAEDAERLARLKIEDSGWIAGITTQVNWYEEIGDVSEVDRDDFLEAINSGCVLVIHQWPADAEDANVDYEIN